ncbi:MAG: hypothetical protein AAF170_00530 [Bacteroidota bacterium]
MSHQLAAALLIVGLAILTGCTRQPEAPPPTVTSADTLGLPSALASRLDAEGLGAYILDREGDAYALVDVPSDTGNVLLQLIDLRAAMVTQILGPVVDGGTDESHFHPTAASPRVELMEMADVVRQQTADDRLLTVLNGAFFETPGEPASQLAYPIAENGRVATGGSSPYGPGRPGAETERWSQPLRALGLADTVVHIMDYDPTTGVPLDSAAFAEAIVSLAPDAHPARTATRFHVLGALDGDGNGTTELLLIATSDGRSTIEAPQALLTRMGVSPDHQLALDGGASVFVWNRRAGTRHQPAPAGGNDPQHLPHALTIRIR